MNRQTYRAFRFLVVSVVLLAAVAVAAYAQEAKKWNYKGEVQVQTGWGRFYHGDGLVGSGAEWGAGVGVKPFSGRLRRLGFEFQANRLGVSYLNNVVSQDGAVTAAVGNVLYHFSDSPVQPYVGGGLGALRAKYTHIIKGGAVFGSNEDYVESVNADKMLLSICAGVKARVFRGFAVRPEFRVYDTTMGSGYNFSSVRLSVGFGYYW